MLSKYGYCPFVGSHRQAGGFRSRGRSARVVRYVRSFVFLRSYVAVSHSLPLFTTSPCSTIGDLRKGRSLRSFVRVPPLLRRDITLTPSLHYLPMLRPPIPHSLQPPACLRGYGCCPEAGYSRTRLCQPPRSVVKCSTWNITFVNYICKLRL